MLESKDNKLIKLAKAVQTRKYSEQEKLAFVESPKIINELINCGFVIKYLFVTNEAREKYSNICDRVSNVNCISNFLAKNIKDTETSTNIFALVDISNMPKTIGAANDKWLILDNIQDPNNMGAIIRSAVAFGYTNIINIDSTYIYSPKVTRCSMGYNYKVNIKSMDYNSTIAWAKSNNIELITCDMNGKNIKNSRPTSNKFAIIIGNEGNGVSNCLREAADNCVSIPMLNGVESLNASVSASIVMFNLVK